MKPKRSDAFRGSLKPEDIALEFGYCDEDLTHSGQVKVRLSDRVELTPQAARRLSYSLDAALKRHATSLGVDLGNAISSGSAVATPTEESSKARPIGVQIPATEGISSEDRASFRGRVPVNAPADPGGKQSSLLLQLVSDWGVPFQHERSFRLAQGSVLANRYLLTVDKSDIPGEALEQTLKICRQLNMPDELLETVNQTFDTAQCIHFGYEADSGAVICKLYLERAVSEEARIAAIASGEPVLLHLAYKWETSSGSNVTTRYNWYPAASKSFILKRFENIYADTSDPASAAIAAAALDLVTQKVPAERLQYLEVNEDQNERKSFDLNVYESELLIKEMQSLLVRMRDHFNIPPGHFQALYDQVKNRGLGHLAGGVHRNQLDFFNIYYGTSGFPSFSTRLDQGK